MAFDPLFKMSIQDESDNYYYAQQAGDGTWSIYTSVTPVYLKYLPDGWESTEIEYQRDLSYMGVFRSQTNSPYKFAKDARAIINYIRSVGGIQGYGVLTIYMINNDATGITYPIFYSSELDFKTYRDNLQTYMVEIGTLDSKAVRDLHAYGDTKFNIPIWVGSGVTWAMNDSEWIYHTGIKLLYNATYQSEAGASNRLIYKYSDGTGIEGYNFGQTGALVPNQGAHTIPFLSALNITQNDGTTIFVGNSILQKQLVQGNQVSGINTVNELKFDGVNNSQPWTKNNSSLRNLLPSQTNEVKMFANVVANISAPIDVTLHGEYVNNAFVGFVFWEIGPNALILSGETQPSVDAPVYQPVTGGSGMKYTTIYKYMLTGPVTAGGTIDVSVPVTLRKDCAYVFGIIYDNDDGLTVNRAIDYLEFSELQFSFFSEYNSGTSTPVDAPMYPPSAAAGFRLNTLFNKVVEVLPSSQSDGYGFPVPVVSDYTFSSTFLSDPLLTPVKNVVPQQILITSDYCMHNLSGQSMVTVSFNQLFDFCKRILGAGLSLIGNDFVLENLRYFFDSSTMILDLGYDVAHFEIEQDTQGVGSNLKIGYSDVERTEFGIDPINSGLFFSTPASNVTQDIDFQESGIITEMYTIEKTRAQQTSQPIGSSINPQNPSGSNQTIAIYCEPTSVVMPFPVENPAGAPITDTGFKPVKFPNAQSTDDTAAMAEYLQGFFYPDTAINVMLSPCSCLYRDTGALIHSVLDKMDSEYLAFRNTYVMQYNNTTIGLSGFATNLDIGAGTAGLVVEHQDKLISTLPDKLYLPVKCKVTSKYPVNMYQILNSNPNGYVRFYWNNESFGSTEYKFFITKAVQAAGTGMATVFEGWFTPDMVI